MGSRLGKKLGPRKRPPTEAELAQRRAASRTGVLKRLARKPFGKRERVKLTEAEIIAKRIKDAARTVDEAKLILRESAAQAARTLRDAARGMLPDSDANTMQRAADSILKKTGIGDTVKIEGGPPVVVHLGSMDEYPAPDADPDGTGPGA